MSTPPPPPSTHSETALAGSSGSSRQGKAADAVPDHIAAPSAADSDREPDRTDVEKMDPAAVRPREAAAADENPLFQPRTVKFWLTLVMNFAALFLVALDRTIIATAVPRISDEFHSLGDVGWYGAAYMLTTSCAQLVYGRIYKFYNLKLVFLVSIIIFEAGSAICGAAPNSPVFIVGRAIAGIGSAGIFAGCMLIMIPMIPLHRRPMFQGLFGMVFGIASVMGPLIGGGLTNGATWRWCFYINLPIGAVVFLFMVVWWRPAAQSFDAAGTSLNHLRRLDPLGLLFLLPSVICLLLALQWGGGDYAWGDWRIILLFVLFAVLLAAFAAVQTLKPDTATIPPRIILQRSIACGSAFTFFLAGSMLMLVYYVPIWFQTVLSVDPLKSGIYTLPLVLSLVVSSILSGIMTGRIGYYVPSMLLSPSLMSVGEGLMSTWGAATPESRWIAYQFLAGFGLGFGMQTSGLAVQTVLPPADIPTGIAINFFVQQLGGAVFTAVGQAILTNLLAQRLADIPGFDPGSIVNQGATKLGATVPAQFHPQVVDAYNYACQRIFLVAMGLAFASLLCALGMEWRSIKKGRQGGGPPGAAAAAGRRDGGARAAPPEKLAPAPEAAAAADGGSAALAGDRLAEKSQAADSSSGEETSVEDTPSELPTDNEGRKRGVVAEEKEAEEALKMRGEGA